MTKYDESFDPPAPIAKITLRNIETTEQIKEISVLLDTGADISLLPVLAIKRLKIKPQPDEAVTLVGFNNTNITAQIYRLQVIFLGKRFTGVYCGIDDDIGIIGRDILNQVSIFFDGLNLTWQKIIEEKHDI